MDDLKRKQIVSLIRNHGYVENQNPTVLVTRNQFFDGNDDPGSIGCNLYPEHPGIDTFNSVFQAIEVLPGVAGVYLPIRELLDEEGMWPYTDTALIVTTLPPDAFKTLLAPLQPDEVEVARPETFLNPVELPSGHKFVSVWWD
jgi:hypothetical protein